MDHPILVFFLAALSIFLLAVSLRIYTMGYPSSCLYGCENVCKNPGDSGCTPAYLNGPQCSSVIETTLDPTIPSPTPIPYITAFSYSEGAGPPLCSPMWYAFRYVDNTTGNYGPLSQWTGQDSDQTNPLPIYSGASTYPCPDGDCSTWMVPTGELSCSSNQPVISILTSVDVDPSSYTLNVHRQVGSIQNGTPQGFDEDDEGDIVGSFVVGPFFGGVTGMFADIMFNPDVTSQSSCC